MTDFPATKKVALEARAWGDETRTFAKLDELHSDPANARLHSPRNIDAIVASLREYGQQSPIVIAEDGKVIAGNGRLEAARKLGLQELWVVQTDLSEMKRLGFAIADNRTAELAEWDEEVLASLLETARDHPELDLESTGWTEKEAEQFWDAMVTDGEGAHEPDPGPTPADRAQERWQVQPGELFQIGPHRLLCGDSTDPASYATLLGNDKAAMVWTDPPYGVEYESKAGKVHNDDSDGLPELLDAALTQTMEHTMPGAIWYMTAAPGPLFGEFGAVLARLGVWRQTLIWVKNALVLGHSDYHYRHEPIFYGWTPGAAHRAPDERNHDTVWEYDKPGANKEHPTMKPVELIEKSITISSEPGTLVLDPFGGSGTTLVAAQRTGRIGAAIELHPPYCAVILERMSALGLAPEKVEP